jgi:hypothetical protein
MRRSLRIAGMIVAVLAAGLVTGRSIVPPRTGSQIEADAGLERPIALLHADRAPLDKVIDSLVEQSHANLVVNWRELQGVGVDAQTPVKLRLQNVTLRVALERVLEQVGQFGGGTARLGYEVRDGVIDVSSEEMLSRYTITRLYDIRDIVEAVVLEHKHWRPPTTPASDGAGAGAGANGSAGGGTLFSSQPQTLLSTGTRTDADDVIDDIVKLVTDTIRADSWRENGGTAGSIRALGGHLIVTHTFTAHAEIARLLDQLRTEVHRETPR